MIDDILNETHNLTAIVAEALGEKRLALTYKGSWYRLRTELRFFRRCLHFVPPEAQAYLIRDVLFLIEKAHCVHPYTLTIDGTTREARATTPIYFTTQPNVAGKTIEECLR